MQKKNFFKGAAILGAAGIITKIIGAFFRIPLGNILGTETMSYYDTAYPIYTFMMVISTAGIPTAIAKLVSEALTLGDEAGAQKILKTSFQLMGAIGGISMTLLFILAAPLANLFGNPLAKYSMMALAPALFFVAMLAVLRGYFNGRENVLPYGLSQIVEQIGRVGIGLLLAFLLLKTGGEFAAAGATFGAAAGGLLGFLLILGLYFIKEKKKIHPVEESSLSGKKVLRNIMVIAIPITIGASVMPVMRLIDSALVMNRLQMIGLVSEANDLYGQLASFASTLVNFPQVVFAAVQISMVPVIASLNAKGDQVQLQENTANGLRTAVVIGLPAAFGLSFMSKEIMVLLYASQLESAISAAEILKILGFGVAFLSVFQVTTGILQGLGKQMIPAKNLFVGAIFKGVFTYVLVGIPTLNVKGAALSTVIAYGVAALLNVISVVKSTGIQLQVYKTFISPFISVLAMVVAVRGSYAILEGPVSSSLATLGAISFAGLVYFVVLVASRGMSLDELSEIPLLGRLIRKIRRSS